jgi:hypothetical protein
MYPGFFLPERTQPDLFSTHRTLRAGKREHIPNDRNILCESCERSLPNISADPEQERQEQVRPNLRSLSPTCAKPPQV